jgi:hypothetical protein
VAVAIGRALAIIGILGALLLPAHAAAEHPVDLLIVVNLGAKVNSVTIEEVRDFFLKKRISPKRAARQNTPTRVGAIQSDPPEVGGPVAAVVLPPETLAYRTCGR